MPARDKTGPLGQGPFTGRRGGNAGPGAGRGTGMGRGGGRRGAGGVNTCECPKCGHKEPHTRGIPCAQVKCPKCDSAMSGDFCLPSKVLFDVCCGRSLLLGPPTFVFYVAVFGWYGLAVVVFSNYM